MQEVDELLETGSFCRGLTTDTSTFIGVSVGTQQSEKADLYAVQFFDRSSRFGPNRTFVRLAASGGNEPILTDAAVFTDGRNTNQSRHSKTQCACPMMDWTVWFLNSVS